MQRFALAMISMFAVTLFVDSAHAADKYGTAGCGLGSLVFGTDKGLVQVLAATTNGTFGTQTFGITSGTSNCEDTAGGAASAKAFIETNREAFAKDVARGQGETIANLSTLAGCQDPNAVGSALQHSFTNLFPNASVADTAVSQSVVDTLKSHPELSCHKLG